MQNLNKKRIQMDTSLLVSTYNWPEALELCLQTVARQSLLPGEVIICDDGSGPETAALIARMRRDFPIPIVHVWHADEGFQLASIRNKGIAKAEGRYIIQIDGDILLHRHFVSDHVAFRRLGCFTTGSRMMINADHTKELLLKNISNRLLHIRNKNWLNALRMPLLSRLLAQHYKTKGRSRIYVKGCNMAFWKADLLWVNGYNESIKGWGNEDSELAIRLLNSGIRKRFIKFSGICYHLYHPFASRAQEDENKRIMQETIESGVMRIENGISKSAIHPPLQHADTVQEYRPEPPQRRFKLRLT